MNKNKGLVGVVMVGIGLLLVLGQGGYIALGLVLVGSGAYVTAKLGVSE